MSAIQAKRSPPSQGRTSQMIQDLPETGAIVVAPTRDIALEIMRRILELRGPEVDAACRVVAITCEGDLQKLSGSVSPIVFDHTFQVFSSATLGATAFALARAANARFEDSAA